MIETTRRSLITGLIALVAAPAIVRAGSLMQVKMMEPEVQLWSVITNGGYLYSDEWSDVLRQQVVPLQAFRRLLDTSLIPPNLCISGTPPLRQQNPALDVLIQG